MLRKVYLTIDDAPSMHLEKKVAFLKHHRIPALFYARGESIEKHPKQIIHAIQNGFLIGNHSYTHPYFSTLSLKECMDEIIKTEQWIDDCYAATNIKRTHKIIRFPFADRGAGANARPPTNDANKIKVFELQSFLKEHHFTALKFQGTTPFIDSHWDWDTEDYKTKHIADTNLYIHTMQRFVDNYKKEVAVLLLHDFDNNHHLFEASMTFLFNQNIEFLDFLG